MVGSYVCRVCLSKDDVEIIFKKENDDLLEKLRLVGGLAIVENDQLPQCICRTCSDELQLAYDLISQYGTTYKKLRTFCLHHEHVPVSFHEENQKPNTEMIQEEAHAATADNTLVAEIVVKEEMFLEHNEEVDCFGSKPVVAGCSKDIDKYEIETWDASSANDDESMSEIYSNDSDCDGNSSERLYKHKINDEDYDAHDDYEENSTEFSDAVLQMNSDIIDIIVKEEAKLADEITNQKATERNNSFHAIKPKWGVEPRKAVTLTDTNQEGGKSEINECDVGDKRFRDDIQAQKKLLCERRTEPKASESLKCEKTSKNKSKTIDHVIKTKILSRPKLNQCPKSFVRLKRLKINVLKKYALLTKADQKYEKQAKLSGEYGLKQQDSWHSNSQLKTCDKLVMSLDPDRQLGKLRKAFTSVDVFKCDFKSCGKTFSCMKNLRQHIIKRHSNRELFTCGKCGKSFATERSMNEHKMLHSNPAPFKCKQCGKRCSSKQKLKQHQITHLNPKLLTCKQCKKSFSFVYLLKEHELLHSNPDAFKCDHCEKRFASKQILTQHKITHTNPKLLTCKQCGKTYANSYLLKEHQMLHSNPDIFKCKYCDKKFLSKQSLELHKITHSNPNALKCEECGKKISTKRTLARHKITHSIREMLTCEKCGKRFLNERNLKLHQEWHLNPDAFKCKHCSKRFAFKHHLKKHEMTHASLVDLE